MNVSSIDRITNLNMNENADKTMNTDNNISPNSPDYTFVDSVARIALYDDLLSAPRVTEIQPNETAVFLETLASTIYNLSHEIGGTIPYTIIREVSENFIHAQFNEPTVTILDKGNTIQFTDQGPGIEQKEKALRPAFTTATKEMKSYIRGVGSGLPIVAEYLEVSHGYITIEDNLGAGSVITISLNKTKDATAQQVITNDPVEQSYTAQTQVSANSFTQTTIQPEPTQTYVTPVMQSTTVAQPVQYPTQQTVLPGVIQQQNIQPQTIAVPITQFPIQQQTAYIQVPKLDEKERMIIIELLQQNYLGVTDLTRLTNIAQATVHSKLTKLEKNGLVITVDTPRKGLRTLTEFGVSVAKTLL